MRVSLGRWANKEIQSKEQAKGVLEKLRTAIRDGGFDPRGLRPPAQTGGLTFSELADKYKTLHVIAKKLSLEESIDYRLKPLIETFGNRKISEIGRGDIEDLITALKEPRPSANGQTRTLSAASVNRTVQLLRHMLNWAVGREYIDRSPFRRGNENLIKLELEDNVRRRRLSEVEEAKLLAVAPPLLRSMIVTALDTGLRRGEMLDLRFGDVDWTRRRLVVRGATTKSGRTRVVPVETERLVAVLPWKELTADIQNAFRRIDLRWHDLRHEYASRLVEKGVPLSQVRDLLGHASITTTERYDNQQPEALQAAARRLERGLKFDPLAAATPAKFQDSFQIDHEPLPHDLHSEAPRVGGTSCDEKDLGVWLGGRDSNPDNVVQSHVSYR